MLSGKEMLVHYLDQARKAVEWKVAGLGERELRWPCTPTGTNLLGLVKHLAYTEYGYLGKAFGRPGDDPVLAAIDDNLANDDMYARTGQSSGEILAFYARARAHADETIAALDLDARGSVPWWAPEQRELDLHHALVRVITETNRHLGHLDILRELTDGAAGWRADTSALPAADELDWPTYTARLCAIAESFPS